MRLGLITNGILFNRISNAIASGHTAVKLDGVDHGQFDCIAFMVLLDALDDTSNPTLKLQGADEDTEEEYVDIAGSGIELTGDDDNDKLVLMEIVRPVHTFNRVVISPDGTNDFALAGCLSLLYNGRTNPLAQPNLHASSYSLKSPAAGTP